MTKDRRIITNWLKEVGKHVIKDYRKKRKERDRRDPRMVSGYGTKAERKNQVGS
jgi:hypothetical protein